MKLYTRKINVAKINQLIKYQRSSVETVNIFSIDGIFVVDNKTIYKLSVLDDAIAGNIHIHGCELIRDNSRITREVVNQIPADHIAISTNTTRYTIGPKSNISLIIEQSFSKPSDLYFEIEDGYTTNDMSINEDLNVFLSVLN